MTQRAIRMLWGCAALAIVLACAPVLEPAPIPTFDPNSVNTSIALTANSAVTLTALVAPPTSTVTNIPLPTAVPSATPSPTATFIFVLATPTVPSNTPRPGSSGLKFDCQILQQSPAVNEHVAADTNFDMRWSVMNMGTESWDENSTDYRFKSGSKLHKVNAYDLPGSIPTGAIVDLKVAMRSPSAAGSYTATWMIRTGRTEFCDLQITILVP